jgi:hypothetical protein
MKVQMPLTKYLKSWGNKKRIKRRAKMWEYRLLTYETSRNQKNVEEGLNTYGYDGWELIIVYPQPDSNVFVFKKPKR